MRAAVRCDLRHVRVRGRVELPELERRVGVLVFVNGLGEADLFEAFQVGLQRGLFTG
ncbi:MAG: hypothetical protein IPI67_39875 [Myxococcales bacterium]|nr:hypothetical protein [Myxococcales bacterium]